MRGDVDGERLARARADAEAPLGGRGGREADGGSEGAEEGRDRREVVGRNVEHRPAARAVEEVCIRMPAVRPADEKGRSRRERGADPPLRDQLPRGLVGGAEEGVRRAADAKAAALGLGEELAPVGQGRRDRLLGVDVLARLEGGADHRRVRGRRREVEHDVDGRIRQQLVDGRRPEAVQIRECICALPLQVGAGGDLERVERRRPLDVDLRDDSAADDADARDHAASFRIRRTAPNERSTAASAGGSGLSCSTTSHSAPERRATGSTRS